MNKHFTFYISLLLLISGLSACGGGENKTAEKNVIQPVHRIDISSDDIIFDTGGSKAVLSARAYDANGETLQVKFLWASSSPESISVNPQTGEVTALKAGSSKITASVQGVVSNSHSVTYSVPSKRLAIPKPPSADMIFYGKINKTVDLTMLFKKGETSLAYKDVCLFDGYVVNAEWLSGEVTQIISNKRVSYHPVTLNRSELNMLDEDEDHSADFYEQDVNVISDSTATITNFPAALTANPLEKDNLSSISIKPIFDYDDIRHEFFDLGISGSVTLFFK